MSLVRLYFLLLVLTISHVQSLHANNTSESALRLLVLGDSLSAGYGLQPEDSFPAQLEEALHDAGYGVRVINASVSGDTTAGGLSRLDWALADQPHMVLVELGGNDALRGLPPAGTYNNLDAILARLENHAISVILAGMQAPRNLGEDYTMAFDAIYPRLADKYALPFYPFFLEGVALNPDLNQADGIHPNAAGVREIVGRILPLLKAELDKINPRH
jgi:acyl-CoA thioesterase-1